MSALLGAFLFVACARGGGKDPSGTEEGVWETNNPLPTEDWSELIAKNRELHALVQPRREAAKAGTGPARTEAENEAYRYGVVTENPLTTGYGRWIEWTASPRRKALTGSASNFTQVVLVDGLADPAVTERINRRIDEITEAVASPWYYPDVSGILSILKERGQPDGSVMTMCSCNTGNILSVEFYRTWTWYAVEGVYHPSVLREAEERWTSGDGRYEVTYQLVDEKETGKTMMCVSYEIRERIGVNFSLVTGEELRLSDLFEAGEDYLGILDDAISGQLSGDFWFDDSKYLLSGRLEGHYGLKYEEPREYDGGRAFTGLTGDEPFILRGYGAGVSVVFPGLFNGHDVTVNLPNAIPAGETDGIYKFQPESNFGELCEVSFGNTWMCFGEKIGSFTVPCEESDAVTVTVYRGAGNATYSSSFGNDGGEVLQQWFSDEAMVRCAERCLSEWSKTEPVTKDCSLVFCTAEVYPNGFVKWSWEKIQTALSLESFHSFNSDRMKDFWIRDGEFVPEEEIFDVSYEELLREMLSELLWRWEPMLSEAEIAEAVTALAPYIDEIGRPSWYSTKYAPSESFGEITFLWPGRSMTDCWGNVLPGTMPSGTKEHINEKLWNFLCNDMYAEEVSLRDPYVLLRHLRMYEGYHFPEYDAKQRMPRER